MRMVSLSAGGGDQWPDDGSGHLIKEWTGAALSVKVADDELESK